MFQLIDFGDFSSFKFVCLDSDLYAEIRGRRTERGLRLVTLARANPRMMV